MQKQKLTTFRCTAVVALFALLDASDTVDCNILLTELNTTCGIMGQPLEWLYSFRRCVLQTTTHFPWPWLAFVNYINTAMYAFTSCIRLPFYGKLYCMVLPWPFIPTCLDYYNSIPACLLKFHVYWAVSILTALPILWPTCLAYILTCSKQHVRQCTWSWLRVKLHQNPLQTSMVMFAANTPASFRFLSQASHIDKHCSNGNLLVPHSLSDMDMCFLIHWTIFLEQSTENSKFSTQILVT